MRRSPRARRSGPGSDRIESAPMVKKAKPGSGPSGKRPTKAAPRAKAAPPPPPEPDPVQTWTGRLQIQATPELVRFLNRQGARPDRGRSTFSLTNVMRRHLDLFLASNEESDPRLNGFPQEYYDLTVEVLAHPWTINADIIRLLDGYIARQAHLPYLLEQAGVERAPYLQAIAELRFPERLHLVEQAHIFHAPPASEPDSDL